MITGLYLQMRIGKNGIKNSMTIMIKSTDQMMKKMAKHLGGQKNNTFLGDKHDITPDPVDQNGHKLLIGIVEPSSRKDRWASGSMKEVD